MEIENNMERLMIKENVTGMEMGVRKEMGAGIEMGMGYLCQMCRQRENFLVHSCRKHLWLEDQGSTIPMPMGKKGY